MKVYKILLMNYKCLAFQLTSVYFIKKSFLLDYFIRQVINSKGKLRNEVRIELTTFMFGALLYHQNSIHEKTQIRFLVVWQKTLSKLSKSEILLFLQIFFCEFISDSAF